MVGPESQLECMGEMSVVATVGNSSNLVFHIVKSKNCGGKP